MSDDHGEGFRMEIPENELYVQFAEHFVDYVMFHYAREYIEEHYLITYREYVSPLHETIKRAIIGFLESGREPGAVTINSSFFKHLKISEETNQDCYRQVVKTLELKSFKKGFTGVAFLRYSATISNMAAFFYRNGLVTAPRQAKMNIINILRAHMPVDFSNFVLEGAEMSLTSPIENESPDSTVSDDTEILNQAKDEVSEQESRNTPHSPPSEQESRNTPHSPPGEEWSGRGPHSPPGEEWSGRGPHTPPSEEWSGRGPHTPPSEQNLSENREQLIGLRQQEGACSKLKKSRKRSAPYSSESSDIDESPLKESKLSDEYSQLKL